MKIFLAAVFAFFMFVTSAQAADIQTVKEVFSSYEQSKRNLAATKMSQESIDNLLADLRCSDNILEGAETLSYSEQLEVRLGVITVSFADVYVTVSRDNAQAIKRQGEFLNRRANQILKQDPSARTLVQLLRFHATWANYFANQQSHIDFCFAEKRINELGGYSYQNIVQAVNEQVDPWMFSWFKGKDEKLNSLSKKWKRVWKKNKKVIASISKKRVKLFQAPLNEVLIKKFDKIAGSSLKHPSLSRDTRQSFSLFSL